MSYDVSWLQENRTGFMRYSGTLSIGDIEGAYSQFTNYLESAERPLHLVVDLTQLSSLNTNLNEILRNAAVQQAIRHPMLGWVIYYDKENPVYTFIASAIGQNADLRVRFCDSRDEAVEFLSEVGG